MLRIIILTYVLTNEKLKKKNMLHAKIVRNCEHLNVGKHEKSAKCTGENAGR